jgi:hypothetical protein
MALPARQTWPLGHPKVRRLVFLTMVLLVLWFSGPTGGTALDAPGRRRLADPKAHGQSAGGWFTGMASPSRARRTTGTVSGRIAARRRPSRRG